MGSSIPRECRRLCRQAAVEQDPARLLTLFLQIDRLVNQCSPKCKRVADSLPSDLAILSIVCPHCWAIIELPGPRGTGKLLTCPWCSGPLNTRKVLSASEYDSDRPGWAQLQNVNTISSE